jgi:hypothetical protein
LRARLHRHDRSKNFRRARRTSSCSASDVRLIAATTEDLADEVREGGFNADLSTHFIRGRQRRAGQDDQVLGLNRTPLRKKMRLYQLWEK